MTNKTYNVKLTTVDGQVLTGQEIAENKKDVYILVVTNAFDAEHIVSIEITEAEVEETIEELKTRYDDLVKAWDNPFNFDVTDEIEDEINIVEEKIKELENKELEDRVQNVEFYEEGFSGISMFSNSPVLVVGEQQMKLEDGRIVDQYIYMLPDDKIGTYISLKGNIIITE